jgi:hypothetical protein
MTTSSHPINEDPKLQHLLEELDTSHHREQQEYHRSRSPSTGSAPGLVTPSGNPIHNEPKLENLLTKLDQVKSKEQFQRWRNSFLKVFEAYLDDANKTIEAELVFGEFGANLAKLTTVLKQLKGFLENGDLTADACTVKARNRLNEVGRQTTVVIRHTEALVPGTSAEEMKAGFTKFNVGAALIRDGFVQYGLLLACTDVLEHFRTKTCLEQVADRQILHAMEQLGIKTRIFCDVMADLGIFKVMTRCRELDVTEIDDSAGELKPNELEIEVPALNLPPPPPPASPPRSPLTPTRPKKKKPMKPRTPKPAKPPPKAKGSNVTEFVVLSIPAARGSVDKSGKAVQVRHRKGPVEEKRNEEEKNEEECSAETTPSSTPSPVVIDYW